MKRTRSINNIFFKIKNNEMKNKITSNIHSNLRINGCNTNTQNTQINSQKNENIFQSPKFIDNNVGNYYDSIETDSIDNKTIIIAGTASNFRKTMNLKSNFITNKEIDKSKNKEIIRKVQTKTNVKKVMKRINEDESKEELKNPQKLSEYLKKQKVNVEELEILDCFDSGSESNAYNLLINFKNKKGISMKKKAVMKVIFNDKRKREKENKKEVYISSILKNNNIINFYGYSKIKEGYTSYMIMESGKYGNLKIFKEMY